MGLFDNETTRKAGQDSLAITPQPLSPQAAPVPKPTGLDASRAAGTSGLPHSNGGDRVIYWSTVVAGYYVAVVMKCTIMAATPRTTSAN
jgi:hypothetical protein